DSASTGGADCTADGWCWSWRNPQAFGSGLRGVWSSSPTDAWAVGPGGMILHFDGARWSPVPGGAASWLTGVWGSGAADVWASSEDAGVYHYDGTSWLSTGACGTGA